MNELEAAQMARIDSHFQADGGVPWCVGIFESDNILKQMVSMLGTEDLTLKLDAADAAKINYLENKASRAAELELIRVGQMVESRCSKALHYVAGVNVASGKTVGEIDAMELEFAPILAALKNHRPDKAATLIGAVTSPAYETMKIKLLSILGGN